MTPPMTPNQWHIHDPSRLVATDGLLMIADTGKENADGYNCGLETWYLSPGQEDWQPGQCLLTTKPGWVMEEIPSNGGSYWAPTFDSPTKMYYSVSGGEEVDAQCIGLAIATGTDSRRTWTDAGEPVTCTFNPEANNAVNMPNSIDPAVFVDTDGSKHLVYGGGRIWMTELDLVTGLQLEGNWWSQGDPTYHYLAKGPDSIEDPGETSWIEAPFIHKRDGFYFLFVNWFGCCSGVDSTYEIHVGRSDKRTGPYLDKDGVDMKQGGGTLVLKKDGRYIGPGHAAVFSEGGSDWFSYHYYDGDRQGLPWVEIRKLRWDAGWPEVTGERFNTSAYFGNN